MTGLRRLTVALSACLVAIALLAVAPAPRLEARATPCEFENVERIVAVGDVHGAYDRFREILREAGITDAKDKWIGGKAHFVQLGDVLDRGPDSLKVLTFLRRLERDANGAGGKVHPLIGNHEAMRVLGDLRYVHPGEYEAFVTPDSVDLRRQLIESVPSVERPRLERETPLGMIEMIRAFGAGQEHGNYIRGLNAVVRINGVLFVHGGISPSVAPMTCTAINDTVRRELGRDFEKTRKTPLTSLAAREDGPLWYRGLANEPDTFAPEFDKMLAAQRARAIVVGHSVHARGIAARFDGKAFLVDTGMQPAYQPDGLASALEIRGAVFTAIYKDRREVLAGGAPAGVASR